MTGSLALEDDYQQNEYNNKYYDDRQLFVVTCPSRHVSQLPPRTIQPRLMAVHDLFRVVKHTDLILQLVPNQYA